MYSVWNDVLGYNGNSGVIVIVSECVYMCDDDVKEILMDRLRNSNV